MTKIKKHKITALLLIFSIMIFNVLIFSVSADGTFKISYDQGIHRYYNGSTPDDFIKGTPPSSFHVNAGGSFTVAENTFTFRDYYFAGWKCTYTDKSGSEKTKIFKPGDTVSDVYSNMELLAVWAQTSKPLVYTGIIYYCEKSMDEVSFFDNSGFIGETVSLEAPKNKPDDSFEFGGWLNTKTNKIYGTGDLFEISQISNTFCAVWKKDGKTVNFCSVKISCGEGGSVEEPELSVMSGQTVTIRFTPKEGYKLSKITVNGKEAEASETFSLTVIDVDTNVKAEFELSKKETTETAAKETDPVTSQTRSSSDDDVTLIIYKETKDADGKIFLNGSPFSAFEIPFTHKLNEAVTVSCSPDEGSSVSYIRLTDENTGKVTELKSDSQDFSFKMDGPKKLTVRFVKNDNADEKEKSETKVTTIIVSILIISIVLTIFLIALQKQNGKKKKKTNKRI